MKVSMDGLRLNLSRDIEALKNIVIEVLSGDYNKEQFIECLNDVIQDSNMLNCVYSETEEAFKDMSDVHVEYIETEEL